MRQKIFTQCKNRDYWEIFKDFDIRNVFDRRINVALYEDSGTKDEDVFSSDFFLLYFSV